MPRDICPSRSDAQSHLFDGGDHCALCLTPRTMSLFEWVMRERSPSEEAEAQARYEEARPTGAGRGLREGGDGGLVASPVDDT